MRTLLAIITTIIALSSCTSKSAKISRSSQLFAVMVDDSRTVIDMRLPTVYAVGDTISLLYIPSRFEYTVEQQHTANSTKGIIIR